MMSAMSHQLTGGRRKKSRSPPHNAMQWLRSMASLLPLSRISSGDTLHSTCKPSRQTGVDAHHEAPARDSAPVTAAEVPLIPFGRRLGHPTQNATNDFREGPIRTGRSNSPAIRSEPCQHTIAVLRPFGKPDPRIDDDRAQ